MNFLRFFLGTPRRLLAVMVLLLVVFAYFRADIIERAVFNLLNALLNAIAPFVQPFLILAVIAIGLGIMLRKVWR